MTTTYQRALAACGELVQILVPAYLSQADCDAALAELPALPAPSLMSMLKDYREESRVIGEYRPILARHGF